MGHLCLTIVLLFDQYLKRIRKQLRQSGHLLDIRCSSFRSFVAQWEKHCLFNHAYQYRGQADAQWAFDSTLRRTVQRALPDAQPPALSIWSATSYSPAFLEFAQ